MFSGSNVVEKSRQYLLRRTEIFTENSRWVPLKDDLSNVSSLLVLYLCSLRTLVQLKCEACSRKMDSYTPTCISTQQCNSEWILSWGIRLSNRYGQFVSYYKYQGSQLTFLRLRSKGYKFLWKQTKERLYRDHLRNVSTRIVVVSPITWMENRVRCALYPV